MYQYFILLYYWIIFSVWFYHIYFSIHHLVDIWLFPFFIYLSAVHIDVQVLYVNVWTYTFISTGPIPRTRIARTFGNSTFNLRNCQTFFKVATSLSIPTSKISISPRPHGHSLLSVFLIMTILVDVRWYFTVVLSCISPGTKDVEHLVMG